MPSTAICCVWTYPLPKASDPACPTFGVAERAAATARALADPTRLRIAAALDGGARLCVCDLAWVTGLAQNLVSHHLRVLRGADLATSRRDGRLVMYTLTDQGRAMLSVVLPAMNAEPENLSREGSIR